MMLRCGATPPGGPNRQSGHAGEWGGGHSGPDGPGHVPPAPAESAAWERWHAQPNPARCRRPSCELSRQRRGRDEGAARRASAVGTVPRLPDSTAMTKQNSAIRDGMR